MLLTKDNASSLVLTEDQPKEDEDTVIFLNMALQPNVSKVNVCMLMFATFVNLMILQFILAFIPYLLGEHYDIPE